MRIYNSLTRDKSEFEPIEPGRVRMYSCGITSYAPSHIGHARSIVAFDVVYRWLSRQYDVTFVRNFTDIDDKIIKAANAQGEDPMALSQRFIDLFHQDTDRLGCRRPTHEPKVTEHVDGVIEMVQTLVDKDFAYPIEGDVYYDVHRFGAYGQLSGRSLEQLEAGARIEVDTRKRSPHDFVLWKSAKPGEPSWDSPWGPGRPGWHIECSVMSKAFLGETFDIHGGGKDLIFPHHENEIAQTCAATGHPVMANVWMHNGFVNLMPDACPKCEAEVTGGEEATAACVACGYVFTEAELKMSKSRNNFYPIQDILERYEPEGLRLLLLSSHYRSPIQFSHARLDEAGRRIEKGYETLAAARAFVGDRTQVPGPNLADVFGVDPVARFTDAMNDDFNSALAIAEVNEALKIANDMLHGSDAERAGRPLEEVDRVRLLSEVLSFVELASDVLGLWGEAPEAFLERRRAAANAGLALSEAEIEALIAARQAARESRDFARADEIRDELKAKGIVLKDVKGGGTTWEAG